MRERENTFKRPTYENLLTCVRAALRLSRTNDGVREARRAGRKKRYVSTQISRFHMNRRVRRDSQPRISVFKIR